MKVQVDFDLCESNALCEALAPDVFELDDDDVLHVLIESPPDDRLEQMREAATRCPKQAITVEG